MSEAKSKKKEEREYRINIDYKIGIKSVNKFMQSFNGPTAWSDGSATITITGPLERKDLTDEVINELKEKTIKTLQESKDFEFRDFKFKLEEDL